MPRARSPDRDKAYVMWCESDGKIKLKDIATTLGVTDSQIRKWKNHDNWDERLKGNVTNPKSNVTKRASGAPKGNKNAIGNIGGAGGPVGNKKAVVTGEHETISWDALSDDERVLFASVDIDELATIDRTIRIMEIRERRMLLRIKELSEGQKMVDSAHIESRQSSDQYGDSDSKTINKESAMERIQRIEEAITRIQEKKGKYIELRSKLVPHSQRNELEQLRIEKMRAEIAKLSNKNDDEEQEDDGFMDALKAEASEVWGDDGDNSATPTEED